MPKDLVSDIDDIARELNGLFLGEGDAVMLAIGIFNLFK
jgi:hypothetical protein